MQKQKKILTYAFLFVAFVIIIANIINILKPKQTPVIKTDLLSTGYDGTKNKLSGISFKGDAPSIPKTLSIATTQPTQTIHQYIRDELIKKYSLEKSLKLEDFWDTDKHYLHYDSYASSYMFGSNSPIPKKFLELNVAKTTAVDFITNTFPNLKLHLIEKDVDFFTADVSGEQAPKDNASVVSFPFTYKVGNYPVFIDKKVSYPITLWINADLKIQKVVFPITLIDLKIIDQANTISTKQAIKNINDDIGSIISSEADFLDPGDISEIVSGNLTSVQVEYRLDKEVNLAYPFYRFFGTITNKDNIPMKAEIITPAIEVME